MRSCLAGCSREHESDETQPYRTESTLIANVAVDHEGHRRLTSVEIAESRPAYEAGRSESVRSNRSAGCEDP